MKDYDLTQKANHNARIKPTVKQFTLPLKPAFLLFSDEGTFRDEPLRFNPKALLRFPCRFVSPSF